MSNVHTFWDDGVVVINIEDYPTHRFVHMSVSRYSPAIKSLIKRVWKVLKVESKRDGITSLHSYTQNEKFAKAIDPAFTKEKSVEYNGETYGVLKWELN